MPGRRILIGASGQDWLDELRRGLRFGGGPVPAGRPAGRTNLAAAVLSALPVGEWLCPVTNDPPPLGFGRLVARSLRAAPQNADTILDAARNRSVLLPTVPRPPADVLTAWLSAQPLIALDREGTARLVDGVAVKPHRLDDILVAELRRRRDRPATTAELRAALLAAGYSAAGVGALLYMSPIPHRIPRPARLLPAARGVRMKRWDGPETKQPSPSGSGSARHQCGSRWMLLATGTRS